MLINLGDWQIRSWHSEDESNLTRYASNRNISINLRNAFPYPYTAEHARAWIELASAQVPESNFAIASLEEAIGGIGLRLGEDVFGRTAEIGYWLAQPYWGQGIATKAVVALTDFAFSEFDLVRVEAHVFEGNPASARVLEKAGYSLEGRLRKSITKEGRTLDRFLYAKIGQ